MTPKQRSALMRLAGEMALGNDLPPEPVAEWGLPKSTPLAARREIGRQSKRVRELAIQWAKEIVRIVDESDTTKEISVHAGVQRNVKP